MYFSCAVMVNGCKASLSSLLIYGKQMSNLRHNQMLFATVNVHAPL